jgi:ring-1,2-phenylacetyl-CoA epoxidase subunit PaaC
MYSSLIDYILHLADTNLILAQRNSEWCGHGPILEQDIALTNITLDLLGQSRYFYQYAAQLINKNTPSPLERGLGGEVKKEPRGTGDEVSEDSLAYLRTEREFKNLLLVEQPNGDWAQTVLRQFLFSQYQYILYEGLRNSQDEQIAAIAAKSIKETTYHLRWSSEWVIRLGDGTNESHARMLKALDELWSYTDEMFMAAGYEKTVAADGTGVNVSSLREVWLAKVKKTFDEARLPVPGSALSASTWKGSGKEGRHTEQLGYILTELQYLQRTYPGASW